MMRHKRVIAEPAHQDFGVKKALAAWLLCSGLCGSIGSASAFPIAAPGSPGPLVLSIASFQGTIPTEAHPIIGEARIAKMRREGGLPDTFVRGRCLYELAGDPGAAYYVRTCR
jgi:hypothetical protein